MATKYCKGCNTTKSVDDFYKTREYLQTTCKICQNKYRVGLYKPVQERKKQKNVITKLPEDKQILFWSYYETMPLTKVAKHVGLNYNTLRIMRHQGLLVRPSV